MNKCLFDLNPSYLFYCSLTINACPRTAGAGAQHIGQSNKAKNTHHWIFMGSPHFAVIAAEMKYAQLEPTRDWTIYAKENAVSSYRILLDIYCYKNSHIYF